MQQNNRKKIHLLEVQKFHQFVPSLNTFQQQCCERQWDTIPQCTSTQLKTTQRLQICLKICRYYTKEIIAWKREAIVLPIKARAVLAVPSSRKAAGIAAIPVNINELTKMGLRPQWSMTKIQKIYEGISIKAVKMKETKMLPPKLVELILIP